MTISSSFASSARLLPIKFLFILIQVMLLVVVLLERQNHVYFEVGQNYSQSSDVYKGAEKILLGVGYTMIGLCTLEFIAMIIGTSVPPNFAKFNLLQIILHMLGCLFTIWFILDSWRYPLIWPLFVCFSVLPILIEATIMQQAFRLNKNIKDTREGHLKRIQWGSS